MTRTVIILCFALAKPHELNVTIRTRGSDGLSKHSYAADSKRFGIVLVLHIEPCFNADCAIIVLFKNLTKISRISLANNSVTIRPQITVIVINELNLLFFGYHPNDMLIRFMRSRIAHEHLGNHPLTKGRRCRCPQAILTNTNTMGVRLSADITQPSYRKLLLIIIGKFNPLDFFDCKIIFFLQSLSSFLQG